MAANLASSVHLLESNIAQLNLRVSELGLGHVVAYCVRFCAMCSYVNVMLCVYGLVKGVTGATLPLGQPTTGSPRGGNSWGDSWGNSCGPLASWANRLQARHAGEQLGGTAEGTAAGHRPPGPTDHRLATRGDSWGDN